MNMGTATKQQNKVPELRFSEFVKEWKGRKLKNTISLVVDNRGKTPPTTNDVIPMIEVNAIGNKKIDYKKVSKFVDQDTFDNWFRKYLEPGDILFSTVGATALCSIYEGEPLSVIAQNIVGLRFDEIDSTFAFYLLTEPRNNHKFKRIQMGAVQPSVKVSQMIHITFEIPEKDEQQKIADFLGSVDEWLENLRQQKTALETYKRGMMQKLFTQQVRFKDDNGKYFPAWKTKIVSKLFEYLRTNSFSRDDLNYTSGNVYNIHYGDIHTTFSSHFDIALEKVPFVKDGMPDGGHPLQEGDVVIADASEDYLDIGKGIEITSLDKKYVVAGLHTMALRRLTDDLVTGYMGHYMKSEHYRLQVMKVAQGAKVLGLSKRYFSHVSVPLPSKPEQQKIADFLTTLDQVIAKNIEEISKVEEWKKGLMQKMFV